MKFLKYIDFFGIHFHFYIGNKRKLYTSYGGIISIIYMVCCLCIFFILTLKEILHKNPISNMSSVSQAGYHKTEFGEEKLWIPWRIIDYNKKFVNYSNKLCPIIYNRKGIKNSENMFIFKTQPIKFKLCNETDFAQRGIHHSIDVSLDELYCMDFDNIELGGGWNTDFLNYIQFDIYLCNNENNKNYKNLTNFINNGTWAIEYFYPIVEYQPTNYENPILVIYKNHFYNFSVLLNKEERIYVQEYVLNDDKGLIFNDDLNSSFWGYISSDFDVLYSKTNNINGNLSSKLYSLNIFLDSGKILYERRYNKIYTIIANVFPIFNAIFFIFDYFSYMVKTIMTEKYLSELFFKRINENDKVEVNHDKRKSTNFVRRKYKINLNMTKRESNFIIPPNLIKRKENDVNDDYNNKNNIKNTNNDFSSKSSENNKEEKNNIIVTNNYNNQENINDEKKNNLSNNNENNKNINVKNKNFNISKNSSKKTNHISNLEKVNNRLKDLISNKNLSKNNNNSNNNSSFDLFNSPKLNNFVELNAKNINSAKIVDDKNKDIYNKNQIINDDNTNLDFDHKNVVKTGYEDKNNLSYDYSNFNFKRNKGFNNSAIITRFRLKGSLFKMKDYIYSFCIKDIRKEYKYLSKDFAAIFNFLSDIYDVSSYLQLYKQFHILTGFLLDNIVNININQKININNRELFEQISSKNKNVFYFALKEQFNKVPDK